MATPILTGAPSQAAFDAILRALAEPGTIRQLPTPPSDDVPAVAMVALALGDIDLGVSVDDDPTHPVAHTLRAATGMTIVDQRDAQFVVCTDGTVPVGNMRTGTALGPEDAGLLAVAVDDLTNDSLTNDRDHAVTLAGPGVDGEIQLAVHGVTPDALASLGRASGEFPTGVDTWLITPDGRIAAISRSTTVISPTTHQNGVS